MNKEREQEILSNTTKEISRGEFFHKLEVAENVWGKRLRNCLEKLNGVVTARREVEQAQEDNMLIHFYIDDKGGVSFTIEPKPEMGFDT